MKEYDIRKYRFACVDATNYQTLQKVVPMDEKQQKGISSELIAEYYLTRAGYFVYTKKSVQSAVYLVAINPITG